MRAIIILIVVLFLSTTADTQNLLDLYKKGTVKLVPDPEFGKSNDWDKVFSTYNDYMSKEHIGKRKSIRLLPDGSFLVNHSYKNFFTKFAADGKFEKEFSIKSSSGKVLKTPGILGVLDDEILFTGVDNSGNLFCADLEGKHIKTLEVKYMDKNIIPLPNRKFAIAGTVLWKDRFRYIVAIKDYETGEEKVIWDSFSPRSQIVAIDIPSSQGKKSAFTTVPPPPPKGGFRSQPNIIVTANNELLVCVANTGELIFYDLEGNKLRTKNVNWKNDKVPVDELLQKHNEARERIANRKLSEKMIERYGGEERVKLFTEEMLKQHDARKENIISPMDLPYFSTIMQDSDNNLLFFEYAKEKGANKFNVYALSGEGEFVCKSSFVCDDYDLVINSNKLVFKDGVLYGVQEQKNKSGIPMRLVKFKLETGG